MGIEIQGVAPLLQVFDMPAAIHFYRDLLGFELVLTSQPGEYFDWALLRLSGVELMLNTQYERERRPAAPDAVRARWHADTCLYFGCRDVDGAYRFLREKGLDVKEPVNREYGMRQLEIVDPDGYHVCFQWPCEPKTA